MILTQSLRLPMMTMKYGKWQAVGGVVTGAIHLRQDKPCQDALLVSPGRVAVADGHGSASCPHSDEGAALAVKIAGEIMEEMLPNLEANKDIRLPKLLEVKWKNAVRKHHIQQKREYFEPFPYILYGTTLLAVTATDEFIFALQIGDGDILLCDATSTPRQILATEERVGEDTYSLCLDDAWAHIRTQIIPWSAANGPAMILLSTDGYANSFANAAGFLKAGTDFFTLWREEGLSYISENLPDWLRASSDKGSGDDIAMALLMFEGEKK